jgi:hypothetical protein
MCSSTSRSWGTLQQYVLMHFGLYVLMHFGQYVLMHFGQYVLLHFGHESSPEGGIFFPFLWAAYVVASHFFSAAYDACSLSLFSYASFESYIINLPSLARMQQASGYAVTVLAFFVSRKGNKK